MKRKQNTDNSNQQNAEMHTPKHKAHRSRVVQEAETSPIIVIDSPPKGFSTPKTSGRMQPAFNPNEYANELSQDAPERGDSQEGSEEPVPISFCDSPTTIRARDELQSKYEKMGKQLAKNNVEKRKQLATTSSTRSNNDMTINNRNNFLQLLETFNKSPSSIGKGKDKITKSFTFGASDDEGCSDDGALENEKTLTRVKQDNSFRKYKSANDFDSRSNIYSDDDDDLILASQALEGKDPKVQTNPNTKDELAKSMKLDDFDSFDECILNSQLIDEEKVVTNTKVPQPVPDKVKVFTRHKTEPIRSILKQTPGTSSVPPAQNTAVCLPRSSALRPSQNAIVRPPGTTVRPSQSVTKPPNVGFSLKVATVSANRPVNPSHRPPEPLQSRPHLQSKPTLNTSSNTIVINEGKISNSNINNNNQTRTFTAQEIEEKRKRALEIRKQKQTQSK